MAPTAAEAAPSSRGCEAAPSNSQRPSNCNSSQPTVQCTFGWCITKATLACGRCITQTGSRGGLCITGA